MKNNYLNELKNKLKFVNDNKLLKELCSDVILFGSISRDEKYPNDIDLAIKCFNYNKINYNLIKKELKKSS